MAKGSLKREVKMVSDRIYTDEAKKRAEMRAYDAELDCLPGASCRGEPCDSEVTSRKADIAKIKAAL